MSNQIIIIGLVLSLFFWELTGLTPGGLIVIGYLVLGLKTPERVAYTIAVSVVSYLLVSFIGRWLLIYGKRRFVAMVLGCFLLDFIVGLFVPLSIGTIGVLVPGIMAAEFEKQGILPTLIAQGIVGGILILFLYFSGQSVF